MISSGIANAPEPYEEFRIWVERYLRQHFQDLRDLFNADAGVESLATANWRLIEEGEDLLLQKNIDGTWTTIGKWSE